MPDGNHFNKRLYYWILQNIMVLSMLCIIYSNYGAMWLSNILSIFIVLSLSAVGACIISLNYHIRSSTMNMHNFGQISTSFLYGFSILIVTFPLAVFYSMSIQQWNEIPSLEGNKGTCKNLLDFFLMSLDQLCL